jgi:hypothetical protein
MAERARVTSLEAVETFRAKLVIYRDRSRRVLDEVTDEVTRTRLWLQNDRMANCQLQIDRARRELQRRQQELFSAQISGLSEASQLHQSAVQNARRALRDAEEKLKIVRQWNRMFDQRVEPTARQLEKLRHILGNDLGLALAWLSEMIKTISAYAEISHTPAAAPKPAPPEDESTAPGASESKPS